uniref:Uncharacterized protein n=1 Tax=Chlamydomonas euryale TaxID=1486919 RepID=A0A7R9YV52_9CHLO
MAEVVLFSRRFFSPLVRNGTGAGYTSCEPASSYAPGPTSVETRTSSVLRSARAINPPEPAVDILQLQLPSLSLSPPVSTLLPSLAKACRQCCVLLSRQRLSGSVPFSHFSAMLKIV